MRGLRQCLHRLLVPVADATHIVAAAPQLPVRTIFSRFWPDARPYRVQLAVGLLFVIAVPAIATLEIYLFKLVVDDVLVPQDLAALLPIALAYLGLTILSGLANFGDDYLATWIGERFLLSLRARLFAHVQGLSLDVLDRRRAGDVLSRLTSDVRAIEQFVLTGPGELVGSVARIVFFTVALLLLSWKLALAAIVIAPLFWLVARSFSRLIKHASREKRRRSGSLTAVAEESLGNAALVQSLNRGPAEVERFRRENEAIMEAELASTRIRSLYAPIVDLIELAGGMLVVGLGVWAMSSGDLTIGGLLVFLAYVSQLYSPVRGLSALFNSLFAAAAGAERVIELLDEQPSVVDRPDARPLPAAVGRVELRDVAYAYPGTGAAVLDGLSLTVEPGETVALVGPSGAGKSTVARLLLRFADPDAGSVRLDGHDLRDVRLRDVRERVGLLAQETLLFEGTVRENIGQGRADASDEAIEAAARAAGVADLLDARVGQRGRALSGGQRQRVSIARQLVRDSAVIVLDEPTTGLDAASQASVLAAIEELLRHRTTIVISHDPDVVARADRVVELAPTPAAAPVPA
ncbi:MAG TPA: ABC transporter ATP-binding protein [Capillimicrobium sp.]|jgi:ABC-type multidrug transport system fused ATPase/permease subunit